MKEILVKYKSDEQKIIYILRHLISSESRSKMQFEEEYIRDLEQKNLVMSTFINNSEAGMYVTDYYTGEILFANKKMVSLGGNQISVDELIGHTCWKLLNEENNIRCPFCPHEKLIDDNNRPSKPYVWEQEFTKYGLWLKIISNLIIWTDGRLAQFNTFYDITDIKTMQKQLADHARYEAEWKMQQNLQVVLDYLPVPITITDVETASIVYANKKCLDMFEYSEPAKLVGHKNEEFLPPVLSDGKKARIKVQEILATASIKTSELECITSTGKILDTTLISCIIDFNGKKSSIGIITDLTAEKEQKRLLIQAAEREREANQLKSNFLSNMSHEIRTPMNAIIGLTEIELQKKLSKESFNVNKKINMSAKNLLQIINDILDLSKIEADKMELAQDEFEIEDVLNSTLLVVSPKLLGKQVELILDLSFELPRFLIGDRTRLWQILRNHLDNAAKFTAAGSIVLTVREDKKRSAADTIFITFVIKDTGSGMDEEQLRRAFLPYEQVYDDIEIRNSGSGLGLPLSKRLCEMMGGTIDVTSNPGYGTIIQFTIPFTRSKNDKPENQMLHPQCLSGLTVLVVDDCGFLLETISDLLKNCGAECFTAQSGEDALKIIHEQDNHSPAFDIVILDDVMKGMNGIETAKQIRKYVEESTKLIIVTAYENLLEESKLSSYGINDVIEKPFIPSQFIKKVCDVSGYNKNIDCVPEKTFTQYIDTHVLICEDVDINQEIAAIMLEQLGITTVVADNGSQGIEILNNGEIVDLILMDLHMPVMNGYKAAQIIRTNKQYDHVPIISLTADAMSETIEKCLKAGMNDVITKPMTFDDLCRMLKKWLPENKISKT